MKRLNAVGMTVPQGRVIDVFCGEGQDTKFTCLTSATIFAALRFFVRGLLKRMPTEEDLKKFALIRKGEKKPLELTRTFEECDIRNMEHLLRRIGGGVSGSVVGSIQIGCQIGSVQVGC